MLTFQCQIVGKIVKDLSETNFQNRTNLGLASCIAGISSSRSSRSAFWSPRTSSVEELTLREQGVLEIVGPFLNQKTEGRV